MTLTIEEAIARVTLRAGARLEDMIHRGKRSPYPIDLVNANYLTARQIYVLAWEYTGMGDPFFNLANFSDHHSLSEEQDRWLWACCFGEVTSAHLTHFKIMKVLSDLREATWGLVQIGISKLDFDFRDYADRFYDRVNQNMPDLRWGQWLKEVTYHA